VTEERVQAALPPSFRLHRREDGFYDILDTDGDQVALLDRRVESDERNDRGGKIGDPYPLTLSEIESIID
jgi:hypothetical protein